MWWDSRCGNGLDRPLGTVFLSLSLPHSLAFSLSLSLSFTLSGDTYIKWSCKQPP